MAVDPLSRTLAAIADPTRRAILARLSHGRATVSEIAEPFDMSLPAISKHLKVLERAELIERGRDAQRRPCILRPEPLGEVADWLESYRALWEEQFQRLDQLLGELKGTEPDSRTQGSIDTHDESRESESQRPR